MEFRIAGAYLVDITESARNVVKVPWLAVSMIQPREDPSGLEMPLHPHEIKPALKLAIILAHRDSRLERQRVIAPDPVLHALTRPGDVAIAQQ